MTRAMVWLTGFIQGLLSALLLVLLAVQCAGCGAAADAGGAVTEWIACPTDLIDCGQVFVCGVSEICVDDTDEALAAAELDLGACEPTGRHQGLCRFCCGPDCGRGCNAFQGCHCPDGAP